MTPKQRDVMRMLEPYKGKTIHVLTSQYTNGINADFLAKCKGYAPSSTLRGLEKRGLIRIDCAYWRGATITVY